LHFKSSKTRSNPGDFLENAIFGKELLYDGIDNI
jgi:hypothetical protein